MLGVTGSVVDVGVVGVVGVVDGSSFSHAGISIKIARTAKNVPKYLLIGLLFNNENILTFFLIEIFSSCE